MDIISIIGGLKDLRSELLEHIDVMREESEEEEPTEQFEELDSIDTDLYNVISKLEEYIDEYE